MNECYECITPIAPNRVYCDDCFAIFTANRCINCDARLGIKHGLYDLQEYCGPCVGALAQLGLEYLRRIGERKERIESYLLREV